MVMLAVGAAWMLAAVAATAVFGRTMENGGPFRIEDELVRFVDFSVR